jgi:hypothetical protein
MSIFMGSENIKAEESAAQDELALYKQQYEELAARVEALRSLVQEYAVRLAASEAALKECQIYLHRYAQKDDDGNPDSE